MCVLLANEALQAQALKSRLERHYDERIDPASFYGALDALEDAGFVESQTKGIHDVYELSEPGAKRLHEHIEWMLAHVEIERIDLDLDESTKKESGNEETS